MASIGDLIMRVVADMKGFTTSVTKQGAVAGDKAGKSFSQKFSAAAKGPAGKGLLQGLGIGAALGGIGLVSTAVSQLANVVGDANQAFLDEERSIQKLGSTLAANIPNWDGNTDAIERTLKARMRLGFSDDEQRESLALLVVATKDETRALEIQATAMDLARLKGISLAEASAALIKVEAGQFRALKALGIQLPKNATAQEALTAVQKAAAGQAEAYAETNEGKLLVSQVKVGEAMEKLGSVTVPAMAAATESAADAITGLSVAFDILDGKLPETNEELVATEDAMIDFLNAFALIAPGAKAVAQGLEATKTAAQDTSVDMREASRLMSAGGQAMGKLGKDGKIALDDLDDALDDNKVSFKTWSARVIESSDEVRTRLTEDARDIVSDVFDPLIARDRLHAQQAEISAAKRILASSKASAAEKRDAREVLNSVGKDREETLLDLAEAGALSQREIAKHLRALEREAKGKTGAARVAFQKLIDKWRELQRLQSKPLTFKVIQQLITSNAAKPRGGHQASGGRGHKGVPVVVGEFRPEVYVPEADGQMFKSVESFERNATSGGSSGPTINITGANVSEPDRIRRIIERGLAVSHPAPPPGIAR